MAMKRPSGHTSMPMIDDGPAMGCRFQLRPPSEDTSTAPLRVPAATFSPYAASAWMAS
jgi:hypothetical protein